MANAKSSEFYHHRSISYCLLAVLYKQTSTGRTNFFFLHFHSQQKTYCKDHFVNVCTIEEYNIESMWDKNRNFFLYFELFVEKSHIWKCSKKERE